MVRGMGGMMRVGVGHHAHPPNWSVFQYFTYILYTNSSTTENTSPPDAMKITKPPLVSGTSPTPRELILTPATPQPSKSCSILGVVGFCWPPPHQPPQPEIKHLHSISEVGALPLALRQRPHNPRSRAFMLDFGSCGLAPHIDNGPKQTFALVSGLFLQRHCHRLSTIQQAHNPQS